MRQAKLLGIKMAGTVQALALTLTLTLTFTQAKLLQLLGIKMALFKLSLRCRWSASGDFESFQ